MARGSVPWVRWPRLYTSGNVCDVGEGVHFWISF